MHEANKLNCVLGCMGQSDSLQHYLICPIMNALLDEHFQFCIGPTVFHRFNLVESSAQCAVMLASSYVAYHTLKQGHRQVVDQAQASGRFSDCCRIFSCALKDLRAQYFIFDQCAD